MPIKYSSGVIKCATDFLQKYPSSPSFNVTNVSDSQYLIKTQVKVWVSSSSPLAGWGYGGRNMYIHFLKEFQNQKF